MFSGFIINYLLGVDFINSALFISHSGLHQEELRSMKIEDLKGMAIIGYLIDESVISIPKQLEYFKAEEDKSRLLTFHCIVYPLTEYCKNLGKI